MNISSNRQSNTKAKSLVSTKKRAAAATPTPVRPRMSVKRRLATPHRYFNPMETPDRFIPNRGMDTARASASLLKQRWQSRPTPAKTPNQIYYETQLRRALFGAAAEEETAMMTFGSNKRSNVTPTRLFVDSHDPYRQDILRSAAAPSSNEEQPRRQHRRPPHVSIECIQVLDAPNVLQDDNLTLLGQGEESLAVALDDQVYLWNKGSVDLLAQDEDYAFSCIKWSNDKKLLALGTDGGVIIFNPKQSKIPLFELFDAHSGYVTAIAWNGMELVAACKNGMTRYNLQKQEPLQATYVGHGSYNIISLQWSGNTIASATHGEIKLWDSYKQGCNIQPRTTMEHSGVKSLEVNPRQPNILVSSGDGGIKLWNYWSGTLRGNIMLESAATKTICSHLRNEILVAHDNSLSLWSLGPKVEKLMEHCTRIGKIIGLEQGLDGEIICLHDNESITFNHVCRQVSKENAQAHVGILRMPTLR